MFDRLDISYCVTFLLSLPISGEASLLGRCISGLIFTFLESGQGKRQVIQAHKHWQTPCQLQCKLKKARDFICHFYYVITPNDIVQYFTKILLCEVEIVMGLIDGQSLWHCVWSKPPVLSLQ